jgi:hypothetical protein
VSARTKNEDEAVPGAFPRSALSDLDRKRRKNATLEKPEKKFCASYCLFIKKAHRKVA